MLSVTAPLLSVPADTVGKPPTVADIRRHGLERLREVTAFPYAQVAQLELDVFKKSLHSAGVPPKPSAPVGLVASSFWHDEYADGLRQVAETMLRNGVTPLERPRSMETAGTPDFVSKPVDISDLLEDKAKDGEERATTMKRPCPTCGKPMNVVSAQLRSADEGSSKIYYCTNGCAKR